MVNIQYHKTVQQLFFFNPAKQPRQPASQPATVPPPTQPNSSTTSLKTIIKHHQPSHTTCHQLLSSTYDDTSSTICDYVSSDIIINRTSREQRYGRITQSDGSEELHGKRNYPKP